jgi:carbon storage regulator
VSGLGITRMEGEEFTIGDDIRVVVIEARRGKARLLIDAPRDVPIHRDNIRDTTPRHLKEEDTGGQPGELPDRHV